MINANEPHPIHMSKRPNFVRLSGLEKRAKTALNYTRLVNYREQEKAIKKKDENIVRLEELSEIDPLTGLYNRRHFRGDPKANPPIIGALEHEISRAIRNDQELSVVMFDIDNFKIVNDTHGHLIGDKVLREIAEVLSKNIRAEDIIGRYGGEEFILVTGHGLKETQEMIERIRAVIETVKFSDNKPEKVTISAGISTIKNAEASEVEDVIDKLISMADIALYKSKRAGRNRVMIFEKGMEMENEDEASTT